MHICPFVHSFVNGIGYLIDGGTVEKSEFQLIGKALIPLGIAEVSYGIFGAARRNSDNGYIRHLSTRAVTVSLGAVHILVGCLFLGCSSSDVVMPLGVRDPTAL